MQFSSLIFLLTAAMAMANPFPPQKREACTPNKAEAYHQGHGHGKVLE
jgi:hypothetical protein